jgi:hypothetical protein
MRVRRQLTSRIVTISAPLLIALGASVAAQEAAEINQADTVLYNGKIVTVDANFRIAQAVAIRDSNSKSSLWVLFYSIFWVFSSSGGMVKVVRAWRRSSQEGKTT